jgi:2-(1,2-epoxy-1,2-dihydrophenyl)acetyl-CoA isomerase
MSEDVLYDKRSDGIALITLNRPESLNAMGGDLMPLLSQYLKESVRDRDVRCVVLTGAGRAFCAGGDGRAWRPDARSWARRTAMRLVTARVVRGVEGLRESQRQTSLMLHTMPKPPLHVNGTRRGPESGVGVRRASRPTGRSSGRCSATSASAAISAARTSSSAEAWWREPIRAKSWTRRRPIASAW